MENSSESNRGSAIKAEDILHAAVQQTDIIFLPLGAVCVSIMESSTTCLDAARSLIRSEEPRDRQGKEMFIFFEFIYFFMHYTLRTAFFQIDRSKFKLLQDFLLAMVPSSAIETYFSQLPSEAKSDLIDEFVERLDKTEVDYGNCSPSGEASPIFALLAKNLAEVLELKETDKGELSKTLVTARRELEGMQLAKKIGQFGQNKTSEQDERRMGEWLNQFRLSSK